MVTEAKQSPLNLTIMTIHILMHIKRCMEKILSKSGGKRVRKKERGKNVAGEIGGMLSFSNF